MSESHLSVTFIPASIVRSCQSTHVRAMLIRAGIVRDRFRDPVREYVWAPHVRAPLVSKKLLSHVTYSVMHKMMIRYINVLNCGGCEREVASTKSPSEPNRVGIQLSQPEFAELVRAHLSVPCRSEPGLSETISGTMLGTMSKLHLSGPHLSGPQLSEPKLPEIMSERIFIAGIIRDYVWATLISPQLSGTMSELHLSQ